MPDHHAPTDTGSTLPPPPTPPPTPPAAPAADAVMTPNPTPPSPVPPSPPLAGQLTRGWRIATACAWIGVIVSFAAVWNTSVQLGLSTWWLGPRGDPQPQAVRLLPFLAPLLMVVGALNNLRWLGYVGLAAAAVTAAFGVGDLGRVAELAALELLIAGLAAVVSIASLSGTYRAAPATRPATEPASELGAPPTPSA